MKLKVTVMYDGSDFNGWQIQPNGRSVQEDIERVLKMIQKQPVRIYGSGRTDAQVHALGQVFHFRTDLDMEPHVWQRALNGLLPSDIRVLHVEAAHDDFHARLSATGKTYVYKLNMGPHDVFARKHVYQYCKELDVEAMVEATKIFLGTHDFTSFNSRPNDEIVDQVRTIHNFDIIEEDNLLTFHIEGTGFLRYMVRMIVGSLVAIGAKKTTYEIVEKALELKDKNAVNFNIDPCGLYLVKVDYNS